MNKNTLLKRSWTFFILGLITTILLIIISIKNNKQLNAIGAIVFFSIMFLVGFVGINIQNKEK